MKSNLSIFLAEDDEDDVSIFKEALNEIWSDTELTVLIDGEKLLNRLESILVPPDIIFLDLNMPRKNGIECLKEIKSNSLWKAIKTIILSTTTNHEQIQKCYFLGADIFVTKVPDYNEFKLNLKRCLV